MSEAERRGSWEDLLRSVEKPGRYTGGEWNAVAKDPAAVKLRVALAFPDVYEVGMSYLGQKILYDRLNRRPDILAERVFTPWPDFERALREARRPLASLESKIPLGDFDVLGFSLLYELNFTNVLTILDLAGLRFRSSERPAGPLVIAGGPAAFNPEPVADLFDLFVIGDGEDVFLELLDRFERSRSSGADKASTLARLAEIPGVYVPRLYEPYRPPGASLLAVRPAAEAPASVAKRVLPSLDEVPFPTEIVVPNVQTVFDRVAVEVARGCPEKCRFCQATSLYAPFRVRDPRSVVASVAESVAATGYEDASLFALSVGDYPYLEPTVEALMEGLAGDRVALSVSSLRPRDLSAGLARAIQRVRKTGFTLVPEAGSERLRRVINKNLTEAEILEGAAHAFREGWDLLKLYVMIGLPTETAEDVAAIPGLVEKILAVGKDIRGRVPRINLSVSSFIPKPHTPFQWTAMDEEGVLRDKQSLVIRALKGRRSVEVKVHPVESSALEAVFSRGDRRLGNVLIRAWSKGARFDSWTDRFRPDLWSEALAEEGLDPMEYRRALDPGIPLPWDHIQTGLAAAFFRREFERAMKAEPTPSCLEQNCGLCRGCEFWPEGPKSFALRPDLRTPVPAPDRTSASEFVRYRAAYRKEGPARFIGHGDLVQTVQRILRRAGIRPAYSEGFHPKMRLVFPPPLPLGMEGWAEVFEFKAEAGLAAGDFLEAANRQAPPGITFVALSPLAAGSPAFHEIIRAVEYGLKSEPDVELAFAAVRRNRGWEGLADDEVFRRLAGAASAAGVVGPRDVSSGGPEDSVRFIFSFDPARPPRPQDFVRFALGLAHPAHVLVRTRFILETGA
ncbi:MAG: TIGR03960 family B12-binding radical SAM protein [Candidatus Aminicenantes bacterium]|nr:TIGR03960 family B12-binding radical SAM protein [Candidatus Aminicenantes bacterium]